jgi:hypothetical protein
MRTVNLSFIMMSRVPGASFTIMRMKPKDRDDFGRLSEMISARHVVLMTYFKSSILALRDQERVSGLSVL